MKTQRKLAALSLLISTLNSQLSTGFAQGSLTPPGAPAPTMKTLAQVEPRTPIGSAPFTISQPGSYYLTTNLTGAVTIAADNVTLDLMGFAIRPASGTAISQTGTRSRLLVRNGVISAPAANGVDISTSTATAGGILEDLRIYDCQNYGIAVGGGFSIRRCQVEDTGLAGIRTSGNSDVRECTVTGCGTGLQAAGSGAVFTDNMVRGNTDNYNFSAGNQLNLLLSEVPESIDWPAHVKLAGSLTVTNGDAITINTNGVTLDLGGHTIRSTAADATNCAVRINSNLRNITISNGFIESEDSGFGYGIAYSGSKPRNVLVSRVSVVGCLYHGIRLSDGGSDGASTIVEFCTVRTAGGMGIQASTIRQSIATDCGAAAIIGHQVSDCRGESSGGSGIDAVIALNCHGYSVSNAGVWGFTIQNCYGYSVSGNGVWANQTAIGCHGRSVTGTGLYAVNAANCTGHSTGTAIRATIANGCYASSGTNSITHKYNMP